MNRAVAFQYAVPGFWAQTRSAFGCRPDQAKGPEPHTVATRSSCTRCIERASKGTEYCGLHVCKPPHECYQRCHDTNHRYSRRSPAALEQTAPRSADVPTLALALHRADRARRGCLHTSCDCMLSRLKHPPKTRQHPMSPSSPRPNRAEPPTQRDPRADESDSWDQRTALHIGPH